MSISQGIVAGNAVNYDLVSGSTSGLGGAPSASAALHACARQAGRECWSLTNLAGLFLQGLVFAGLHMLQGLIFNNHP